jgi:hypothetical protein
LALRTANSPPQAASKSDKTALNSHATGCLQKRFSIFKPDKEQRKMSNFTVANRSFSSPQKAK